MDEVKATLIEALLRAYNATKDKKFLKQAEKLMSINKK